MYMSALLGISILLFAIVLALTSIRTELKRIATALESRK